MRKIIEMKYKLLIEGKSPKLMKSFEGTYFIEHSSLTK